MKEEQNWKLNKNVQIKNKDRYQQDVGLVSWNSGLNVSNINVFQAFIV